MPAVKNEELIDSSFYGYVTQNYFNGFMIQFFISWLSESPAPATVFPDMVDSNENHLLHTICQCFSCIATFEVLRSLRSLQINL